MTRSRTLITPMTDVLGELNDRSREIFRHIVDAYVETGEPIGSRTLSRRLGMTLSPATIRNVMADLEELGLPDGAAHLGRPPADGRRACACSSTACWRSATSPTASARASRRSAPPPAAPRRRFWRRRRPCCRACRPAPGWCWRRRPDRPLKHIEFVSLGPGRALVVLVTEGRDGGEPGGRGAAGAARLDPGPGVELPQHPHRRPHHRRGADRDPGRDRAAEEPARHPVGPDRRRRPRHLVGRRPGHADSSRASRGCFSDVTAIEDLERIRALFEVLETKEAMLRMLEATQTAEGRANLFSSARRTSCSAMPAAR